MQLFMDITSLPTRLALALMCMLSLSECKDAKSCVSFRQTDMQTQQSTEQLTQLTQREALLQGLVITFDSVAITLSPITGDHKSRPDNPSPITADTVPPHVVNLIARKASIEKSDIRTVTYEGRNAQRDTMVTHEERVEIVKEEEEKDSGGKPPNWTVILIVLGGLLIVGGYIMKKARP